MSTMEQHSDWWYRWTWLKAKVKGMPLGYRRWREHVEHLFETEATLRLIERTEALLPTGSPRPRPVRDTKAYSDYAGTLLP